jgi:hypothetical protein
MISSLISPQFNVVYQLAGAVSQQPVGQQPSAQTSSVLPSSSATVEGRTPSVHASVPVTESGPPPTATARRPVHASALDVISATLPAELFDIVGVEAGRYQLYSEGHVMAVQVFAAQNDLQLLPVSYYLLNSLC